MEWFSQSINPCFAAGDAQFATFERLNSRDPCRIAGGGSCRGRTGSQEYQRGNQAPLALELGYSSGSHHQANEQKPLSRNIVSTGISDKQESHEIRCVHHDACRHSTQLTKRRENQRKSGTQDATTSVTGSQEHPALQQKDPFGRKTLPILMNRATRLFQPNRPARHCERTNVWVEYTPG